MELMDVVVVMERLGDERGLVRVWDEISSQHNYLCKSRESVVAAKKAAAYAVAAGDERTELESLANSLWRGLWGHVRPEDLLADEERLKPRIKPGTRFERLLSESTAASLALLDRIPEAVAAARAAAEQASTFGIMTQAVACQIRSIVWTRADPTVARDQLEWSDGILAKMGETAARSSTGTMLADMALQLGDTERAESALATVRGFVVEDDFDALARALAVECKLAALRGDKGGALELGRRALEISEPTEYLMMRTRVLTLVAEAREVLGDTAEAANLYRRALVVAEEKGDLWSIRTTKETLARLSASA
jgi:tetratricopeptide (TPR) repeat protein